MQSHYGDVADFAADFAKKGDRHSEADDVDTDSGFFSFKRSVVPEVMRHRSLPSEIKNYFLLLIFSYRLRRIYHQPMDLPNPFLRLWNLAPYVCWFFRTHV